MSQRHARPPIYSTDFEKQFLVDETGERTAVVVPMEQWTRIEALFERLRGLEPPRGQEPEDEPGEYGHRSELRSLLQFIGSGE